MIAYFDCFSGISGDMVLGSLVDLGVPINYLKENISKIIPESCFDIVLKDAWGMGIKASNIFVTENNLESNLKERTFLDIKNLITDSLLSDFIKQTSLKIFEKLAFAEAKVHGCLIDKVHFHEVGAIDSIIDIVGTAICLEYLKIDKIIVSKIPLSSGFVSCRHGILPLPAPAVLEILSSSKITTYGIGFEVNQEITTPTGIAIVAAMADSCQTFPKMLIEKIGYGAGKNELKVIPNLLRIIIGKYLE